MPGVEAEEGGDGAACGSTWEGVSGSLRRAGLGSGEEASCHSCDMASRHFV